MGRLIAPDERHDPQDFLFDGDRATEGRFASDDVSEQVARDRRLAGVLELERAPLVEQRAHRRVVGQPQRAGFAVFRLDRLPQIEARRARSSSKCRYSPWLSRMAMQP